MFEIVTYSLQDAEAFQDFSNDHMFAVALGRRCQCQEELGGI